MKFFLLFAIGLSVLATALLPFTVSAASEPGGIVPCHPVQTFNDKGEVTGIDKESLCQFCDIFKLIRNLFDFLTFQVTPALSVVLFVIGGILLMASGADEGLRTRGKTLLKGTVYGVLIVLFSWIIVSEVINLIANTGAENQGFPWPWDKPCLDVK